MPQVHGADQAAQAEEAPAARLALVAAAGAPAAHAAARHAEAVVAVAVVEKAGRRGAAAAAHAAPVRVVLPRALVARRAVLARGLPLGPLAPSASKFRDRAARTNVLASVRLSGWGSTGHWQYLLVQLF